jgi:hypothetical protein
MGIVIEECVPPLLNEEKTYRQMKCNQYQPPISVFRNYLKWMLISDVISMYNVVYSITKSTAHNHFQKRNLRNQTVIFCHSYFFSIVSHVPATKLHDEGSMI